MKTAAWTAGAVLLLLAAPARAQDWPQWRGAHRNGKVEGFALPKVWPKALTQKWKVEVGEGYSTPALVGDRLYVLSRQKDEEVIRCLSAADGNELWQSAYPAPYTPPKTPSARGGGPRSSPAVADGRVYTLGINGALSCLSASDGSVLWRKEFSKDFERTAPEFGTAASPLLTDGLCIVHVGGKGKGAVMAFDPAGERKWKWDGDAPSYASPVVLTVDGAKQVVTQTEKFLVGISLEDGKALWQAPFLTSAGEDLATPVIDGTTVIASGLGRPTTALQVRKDGAKSVAMPVWDRPRPVWLLGSPVLKDGLLYGLSQRTERFVCMDRTDGNTLWTGPSRLGDSAAIVDVGAALLLLTSGGELHVFRPGDKAYVELARYKVAATPTYAHPVVSGKRIFVKDKDSVTLWTLE
jgi:outer membrane protein assembly factor BamB